MEILLASWLHVQVWCYEGGSDGMSLTGLSNSGHLHDPCSPGQRPLGKHTCLQLRVTHITTNQITLGFFASEIMIG